MILRSLVRRRPSAALVVSFLALFVALGGAGWAALRIPPHSVGNVQLQNFSVGNAKLKPNSVGAAKIVAGAVGARQVDSSQVQLRVTGPCSIGAIQSVAVSGNVTCTPVMPNEYGTSAQATLGSGQTTVASETLPAPGSGASYLVIGNVRWDATENATGPQSFELDCSLTAGTGSTSADATVDFENNRTAASGAIPLIVPADVTASMQTAQLTCQDIVGPALPAPTVTVNATVNAIQTASNN
jgi:hypothetical protein